MEQRKSKSGHWKDYCRQSYVDRVVAVVENWIHDAILTAMDNVVIPRVEMALRSIAASSGRWPNSVFQKLDQTDFSGNKGKTPLRTAFSQTDLNIIPATTPKCCQHYSNRKQPKHHISMAKRRNWTSRKPSWNNAENSTRKDRIDENKPFSFTPQKRNITNVQIHEC